MQWTRTRQPTAENGSRSGLGRWGRARRNVLRERLAHVCWKSMFRDLQTFSTSCMSLCLLTFLSVCVSASVLSVLVSLCVSVSVSACLPVCLSVKTLIESSPGPSLCYHNCITVSRKGQLGHFQFNWVFLFRLFWLRVESFGRQKYLKRSWKKAD